MLAFVGTNEISEQKTSDLNYNQKNKTGDSCVTFSNKNKKIKISNIKQVSIIF